MNDANAAKLGEQSAVASLLAAAFAGDPFYRTLLPQGPRARLFAMYRELLRSGARDVVDVVRDPQGHVVATALWQSPRSAALAGGPDYVATLGPGPARRLLRYERVEAGARPGGPHWYLSDIAVAPQARGHGTGSTLLRRGLARVDRTGLPTFLEATTPASRRLYERFGFAFRRVIAGLPGTAPYGMVRPAAVPTPRGERRVTGA